MISIYALAAKSKEASYEFFYVGSSKNTEARLSQHKKAALLFARQSYYVKMRELGVDMEIVPLI